MLGNRFRSRHASEDLASPESPGFVEEDLADPRSRRESTKSATSISMMSDIGPASPGRSADRSNEPMGLYVLHTPPGPHNIDIIFVHGLGGSSRLTWSHERNLANFWPKEWLPQERGFKDARILTFGYNANFRSQAKDVLDISAFAESLLLALKFFCGREEEALGIGKVPIIFVVHSMGGLVVKKAYILGCQDKQYRDIIKNVCSIVFLATPHRGSNLAEMLSNILSVISAPKLYVDDLKQNSVTISGINDQFRHVARNLDLVSFFEALPTSLKYKKMIIVEKNSAVLGYPEEIAAPLNADHHGVCKFKSRQDSNYISVRDVVKSLVDKFKIPVPTRLRRRSTTETDSMKSLSRVDEVRTRLEIKPMPLDKLTSTMDQYVPYSCDWLLSDPEFQSFMNNDSICPAVLHITGGPGTGKTVMSSFLVQHLESSNLNTQFWYFQYDDNAFRSNRQCLLSLSFQMMDSLPEYKLKLSSRKAGDLETIAHSDLRSLWQKLFLDVLEITEANPQPLYWVIDAVDESESAHAFFKLLGSLNKTRFPLRIILLTRAQTVTKHYEELRKRLPPSSVTQLALATPEENLELFINDRMAEFHWDNSGGLKDQIRAELLRKSGGSYLWLYLVMGALAECYGEDDLIETLGRIPPELTDVYQRLEETIVAGRTKKEKVYATAILSWVTCAERPLNKDELSDALQQYKLIQVAHTINRLCGDFVVINKKGVVTMTHHTARDYILNSATSSLRIDAADAHTIILDKCLQVLMDTRLKWQLKTKGTDDNIRRYCCLAWANHLVRSNVLDGPRLNYYVQSIKKLLSGQAIVVWIEAVTTANQLSAITATSRALLLFSKQLQDRTANEYPGSRPIEDIDFISSWATELVRIVGKFGSQLIQCPSAIYNIVPLFCPPSSVLSAQTLAQHATSSATHRRPDHTSPDTRQTAVQPVPRVTGIANTDWDDSLAKLTFGPDQKPMYVYGLDSSFGVLSMDHSMHLYDASTFQEISQFSHDELVVAADFNRQGTLLVTAGVKTVKVWRTTDGSLLKTVLNPKSLTSRTRRMRAHAVTFSEDASEVIMFCIDSTIRRQTIFDENDEDTAGGEYSHASDIYAAGVDAHKYIEASPSPDDGWTMIELYESGSPAVAKAARFERGSAKCVSFSRSGSQVAVSYRVWPTSVWDTKTGNLIGRCERRAQLKHSDSKHYDYSNMLTWNPVTEHVVGISTSGVVFKWDPAERFPEDMKTQEDISATNLAVSPDGRLLVTSERDGSLKAFSFDNFTLLFNLTSMKQPTSMAFSSDGRRIYDIRAHFCNVWQPNALLRVAEQDEHSSDAASSQYDHSLTGLAVPAVKSESMQPVTAIAASGAKGSIAYAFGNDVGSLKYYSDTYMTSVMESLSPISSRSPVPVPADILCGSMDVTCIAFSSDGTTMATATLDNQVAVRMLLSDTYTFDTSDVIKIDAKGFVLQVVLDSSGKLLLVHTRDATRVWKLSTKQTMVCVAHDGESCQWLMNPTKEFSFVAVQPSGISMMTIDPASEPDGGQDDDPLLPVYINYQHLDTINWSAVAPKLSRKLHQDFSRSGEGIGQPSMLGSSSNDMAVHRVFPNPEFSKLLVQMSAPGSDQGRRETRFIFLDAFCLAPGYEWAKGKQVVGENYMTDGTAMVDHETTLHARALPQPILDLIEIPLGFMLGSAAYSGGSSVDVLVFIDREFWVRTWRLDNVDGRATKRHFFIPSDWINMDCLDLAMVTLDGRLLCPRNGEVAVVHNGLSGLLYADL